MRPLELTLEGFGSYAEKTTIDFSREDLNLFLVSGDTGAGKSTIFEAIVFALYGSTNSDTVFSNVVDVTADGKQKKRPAPSSLVSHYSTAESRVTLKFAMGSGETQTVYTIIRQPARPPRAGSKNTRPATVSLRLPDGSTVDQVRAVDSAIQEILKLDKSQFMQIGMLAQGKFMSLLTADNKEKSRILSKLFDTSLYSQIEEEVKKEASAAKNEIDRWWNNITGYAKAIVLPDAAAQTEEGAADHGAIRAIVAEIATVKEPNIVLAEQLSAGLDALVREEEVRDRDLRVKAAQAEKARKEAEEHVKDAKDRQNRFDEAAMAQKELARLQAEKPEKGGLAVLARKLESAFRIASLAKDAAAAEKKSAEEASRLKSAEDSLPALREDETQKAEAVTSAASAYKTVFQQHTQLKKKYDEADAQFKEEARLKSALRKDEKSLRNARTEHAQAVQDSKTHAEETEAKKKELEELADVDLLMERRKREDEAISDAANQLKACSRALTASTKAAQAARAAEERYNVEEQVLSANRARLLGDYAGVLASELEPGKPCPVCGSTEHPAPHKPAEDLGTLTMESVEEDEKRVDALRKEKEEAQRKAAVADEKYKASEEQLNDKLASVRAAASANAVQLDGDEDHGTLVKKTGKAVCAALEDLEQDKLRAEELRRDLAGADKKTEQLQKRVADADKEVATLDTKISKTNEALQTLRSQFGFASREEAEEQFEQSAAKYAEANDASESARKALEEAQKSLNTTEATVGELEKRVPVLRLEADQAREAYNASLAKEQMGEEEWRILTEAHTPAQIAEYDKKYNDFMADLHTQEGVAKAAAAKIEGRELEEIPPLEALAAEAAEKASSTQHALGQLEVRLGQHRETSAALRKALEDHAEQAAAHARLQRLADRLNGKESQRRLKLETFVQRAYFEAVLDAANARFRDMTGDQYELQLVDERRAGLGASDAGLELMIYSNATGQVREIRTLSGGESFLAALSLALGMADVIEQQSAAVSLDMMFVDEGFGSLDDNSRREAVRILQQLTEGDKLIGIISHVNELKHEIDDQLLVTKDGSGSHAVWN